MFVSVWWIGDVDVVCVMLVWCCCGVNLPGFGGVLELWWLYLGVDGFRVLFAL